jgi:hypothetical protein
MKSKFKELKQYKGTGICMSYPQFLKIRSTEPEWSAFGPRYGSVLVLLNPAQIHSELIRAQNIVNPTGIEEMVIREGEFHSAKGIAGFERLSKFTNPLGQASWTWEIDGVVEKMGKVIVRMCVAETYWQDGKIWEEFVNSIEWVGESVPRPSEVRDGVPATREVPSHREWKLEGVLAEFPEGLRYLLDVAAQVVSFSAEELEDDPKPLGLLESCLRQEMNGLSDVQARARIRDDRNLLGQWLKTRTSETGPEVEGLHIVHGMLHYAGEIFR